MFVQVIPPADCLVRLVLRDRREHPVTERSGGGIGAPDPTLPPLPQASNAKSPLVCDDAQLQRDTVHNWYLCAACPLEWDEYAAFEGPSFCPCCDEETQPYDSIDLREDAA